MKTELTSERLEAFSDGVFAIIITIMVLNLKVPSSYTLSGLIEIVPTFISYFISFLYVSVYWVGHHHLFKLTNKINEPVLWANLLLLFWISLIPFTTSWIGDGNSHNDIIPVLFYGIILLMSEISYLTLRGRIVKIYGKESTIGKIIKRNKKDIAIISFYFIGLSLAFLYTYAAILCFIIIGLLKVTYLKHLSKRI